MNNNGLASSDGWMETFTGVRFDLWKPRPEDVNIEDIAHALSLQGRFNGHSEFFWSVAQHSLLVADYLFNKYHDSRIAMLGLLHDAAEAYIGDITTPIKAMFPQVRLLEDRIMPVIYLGLCVCSPTSIERRAVKDADITVLGAEAMVMMKSGGVWYGLMNLETDWEPITLEIHPESMELVEMTFLKEYYRLKLKGMV